MDEPPALRSLVGVYHADGGPIGEAKYVFGKLLGTAHCALCDITHSPVRRKPAWDRMVAELGLPVELVHLNEMDAEVAAATAAHGSPVILGRRTGGTVEVLLLPEELEVLGGSVEAFRSAVENALSRRGSSEGHPMRLPNPR
ncbi:MAG TPA: hypothetical protein VES03_08000 [Motilibacterales bacterium]|nr:hypothetical protein [Motilibacterales bacterium]